MNARLRRTPLFLALLLAGCTLPNVGMPAPSATSPARQVMLPNVGMGVPPAGSVPASAPTRPVSAAATAVAALPGLAFCAHNADFKPAAPACNTPSVTFEPGVARVNGVFAVAGWPGTRLSGRWYRDGQPLADPANAKTRALCWEGAPAALGFTASGAQFVSLSATALGVATLPPGVYRFELYVDDTLTRSAGFVVGTPGALPPNVDTLLAPSRAGRPAACAR
ncbi:MAG: hypothetical protein K1X39_02990 [Thermoflexales bacterium]|nr:hypothetical protein [Thermoflexales bacterium]